HILVRSLGSILVKYRWSEFCNCNCINGSSTSERGDKMLQRLGRTWIVVIIAVVATACTPKNAFHAIVQPSSETTNENPHFAIAPIAASATPAFDLARIGNYIKILDPKPSAFAGYFTAVNYELAQKEGLLGV